ncbi:MAG TPA: hypothetical protein VFN35_02420, partial [Ktedonobacteraceae bacterium]|nr:hypothetical protein [Ktedonobacteraceae bacterium]
MTAEQLLQELEALTYAARIRHMVNFGRAAIRNSQLAATLTTLEQRNFYERFLAISSCFGSRDGAHVLRALTDPSRIIRGIAINLVPLACTEAQLRQALAIVPHDGRRPLLWKLHHHGYQELIDEFFEQLAQANDLQLLKILPIGSPSLVRQQIAPLQSSLKLDDWRRLTRHHPMIAFALLQEKATAATHLDLQLVAFVNSILPILARKQPDLALTLVETLAHFVPLSRMNLHALLLQRPTAIADLVLQKADPGNINFMHVAHMLDNARFLALQEKYLNPTELVHYGSRIWRKYRKPEKRLALSLDFFAFLRDEHTCLPVEVLALCPRLQREQEGRRSLGLSALAAQPERRLPYAAFLPWDEATSILEPFLHDPREKLRTLAIETLTQVVHSEHDRLPTVLAIIQTHLHEPDPIREAMLRSLVALPRGIWRMEHLEKLEAIVQGTLAASDTSAQTVGEVLLLLTRLLDSAPEWSATSFARILQTHHFAFRSGYTKLFSANDIRLLEPALQPVLNSLAQKGNEETLLSLCTTFHKHLRIFNALLNALELALTTVSSIRFGNIVLTAFFKYQPERAARLIPELIRNNNGQPLYPAVILYLHL